MYIIKRGKLDVVADDGIKVFVTLGEGVVFGELRKGPITNMECLKVAFVHINIVSIPISLVPSTVS